MKCNREDCDICIEKEWGCFKYEFINFFKRLFCFHYWIEIDTFYFTANDRYQRDILRRHVMITPFMRNRTYCFLCEKCGKIKSTSNPIQVNYLR